MAYPAKAKFNQQNPKVILNFNQVFKIIKKLGEGSFGLVVKVQDQSGNFYALKMLKTYDETAFHEIEMLIALGKYPQFKNSIVQYYDYFLYNRYLCILMEFIDGIDAQKYFSEPFGLEDFLKFAKWLTYTISQLHVLNYVHRDIKPENIMVTKKGYKLIDFGLSCRTRNRDPLTCTRSLAGSPVFMSPELWYGAYKKDLFKYYKTSDVYAVGVTLYYILSNEYPYKFNNEGRVVGTVYKSIEISPHQYQGLDKIIHAMVYLNPDNRLTALQAFNKFKDY